MKKRIFGIHDTSQTSPHNLKRLDEENYLI